jgi:hypothetical protein
MDPNCPPHALAAPDVVVEVVGFGARISVLAVGGVVVAAVFSADVTALVEEATPMFKQTC